MRSPQTMGDECPLPGIDTFQRMFSDSLQRTGMPVSLEVPSPRGPRQPGHSSPITQLRAASKNAHAYIAAFVIRDLHCLSNRLQCPKCLYTLTACRNTGERS